MTDCRVGVVGTGVMATGTAALLIGNGYPTAAVRIAADGG